MLSPWGHRHHYHTPSHLVPYGSYRRGPTWSAFADMDDTMRMMERHFDRLHSFMDSAWRDFGRDMGYGGEGSWGMSDIMHPEMIEEESGAKKYRLNIYLGENFAPENVKVNLKDRVMTIEAEKKFEDDNSRVYKHVSRKFTLPPNLDLKEVHSTMGPNGVLCVEAPMPQQALPEPPKPTEIPIHLE